MKINLSITLLVITLFQLTVLAQKDPSFEEVISLRNHYNPVISPDGNHVVFEVSSTDWKENKYDRELWLSKNGATPFQLTNNPKSSSRNPKWSPDGKWIAFISNRNEKNQIHVIRLDGGEAMQVTDSEVGISNFEWAPGGRQIAFTQSRDKSKQEKDRKEKYGAFAEDDAEYSLTELWVIDFVPSRLNLSLLPAQMEDSVLKEEMKPRMMLDSVDFNINDFEWSPDGKKIVIEHQPDPLINTFFKADISILDVATKINNPLVSNPSYDGLIGWSPDGRSILYSSSLDDTTSNYYLNNKIFNINIDGTGNRQLAGSFDEDLYILDWNDQGIYGVAWQKTDRYMVRVDPESGEANLVSTPMKRLYGYSISDDGKQIAFNGVGDNELTEVYKSDIRFKSPKKLTNSTDQIKDWAYAQSEVIQWESEDGAIIEGVLHKPFDYDPNVKYPLLVIIHGGPTGISTPHPAASYVYPILQWLNKGALILRPNYRGSAGYGEEFRSLNVKNLGVGDAWDVLSGVQHLQDKGLIDGDKVGCMGWSQGGYISAFLTTNSDKFKAISVGAGISNWMTYYVNTDIHPFTRQYLKGTPWSDKDIYEKTSPMTNINNASTPTLIQHGEFDRRVPTANAYELVQGLRDVGVESKLIIYKGFGHGINKPKERLAAMWHNWQWFAKYIWDEEVEMPE